MSKIGVIIISYNADPEPLFNSLKSKRHDVRPYIFLHSQDVGLKGKLSEITAATGARYFPYGVNRGVARSWNEGLSRSFNDGNDATLLINDDLFFYRDGFDAFADFVLSESRRVPEFGTISLYGLDTGTSGSVGAGKFYQRPHWQGAACMAIGRNAIETVGYFDQNFWPAYFEDADYFRRLELSGIPNLWDERILVEHNRSQTVRADFLLKQLHDERIRRNERYYIRKWGGLRGWGGPEEPPGQEFFTHPFNDPSIGRVIPLASVDAPYGPKYDRLDLGESAIAGVLGDSTIEELMSLLHRHAGAGRRLLEWGAGENTAIMAHLAHRLGAELLLSIDHRAEYLRTIVNRLPRYPFLHPRFIDAAEVSETGADFELAYVAYPSLLRVRFDIILIAGRWRTECALQAQELLEPGGIVVFQVSKRGGEGLVQQLFNVIEESDRFLVLRGDLAQTQPRSREGARS
jgi:GT2 family glycosyltransferase